MCPCKSLRPCAPCPAFPQNPLVAQLLDRRRVVDPPDGLAQQVGNREDGELWELLGQGDRDGVTDDDLLEEAAAEALNRGRAEDGVRAAGVDLAGTLLMQHLGGVADGACCVDHVVHQDGDLWSQQDRCCVWVSVE